MKEGVPSKTAFGVAVRRAAHQLVDQPPVFSDPLAIRIVGEEAVAKLRRGIEDRNPIGDVLRAFVAARSRYSEDELAKAYTRRVRQCIVLGAGLDTFAYRNPHTDMCVFEVDHPATQQWKHSLLAAAGIPIPPTLTYAPVNFENETAAQGLRAVGFREDQPAFISWLGVTPYLSEQAFAQTINWVGAMPSGTTLVFDYGKDPSTLGFVERFAFNRIAKRVANSGEPFRLFRDPDALAIELRAAGFLKTENLSSQELNTLYFAGRADGLRLKGSLGQIMRASK
ncbi:class I SAM-dependent methyltransferase [soil metagenome]